MVSMANTSFQLLFLIFPLFLMFVSLEAGRFSSNSSNSKPSCIEIERKALVELKKGLTDASGLLSSWVGNDCCMWMGVGCSNQIGNVVVLKLGNLDCYNKKIGYAPTTNSSCLGGSLEKLSYLNLFYASFFGMIPSHLGNPSNLHHLDLFALSSWVSNLNWLVGLSSLKYLNLGYVNLTLASTNWLQALNMLPSLSELRLQNCELHNLPCFVPNINFTSFSVLDLSDNNFNSSIP
ncbi:hypothetical protein ACSBR2_026574 [Camellia fascicularis]